MSIAQTDLFRRNRRGGRPKARRLSRPRVALVGQLTTIAHRTLRGQSWRKRKHKGTQDLD